MTLQQYRMMTKYMKSAKAGEYSSLMLMPPTLDRELRMYEHT